MKIAFRVDASTKIGAGHFMRCLALAKALEQYSDEVCFACRELPDSLLTLLQARNYGVIPLTGKNYFFESKDKLIHSSWLGVDQNSDFEEFRQASKGKVWDRLIVDHYGIDARWELAARECAQKIAVIDDIADRRHECDLLLDQNIQSGTECRYAAKLPDNCEVLFGPRYALLREEFLQCRKKTKVRKGVVKNIVVFFGGVDVKKFTLKSVSALRALQLKDVDINVIVGSQNPNKREIQDECMRANFKCHIQVDNIAELMRDADVSIGAGGVAVWERCCLGLPTLSICTADNQREQLQEAAREGLLLWPQFENDIVCLISLHMQALINNESLRTHLSSSGIAAVDGHGAERVAKKIRRLGDDSTIVLRLATSSDATLAWQWRNHPNTRKYSFDSEKIPFQEHLHWWNSSLTSLKRKILIATYENRDIGVLRYDLECKRAIASIYLNPDFRGQGLASKLLCKGNYWLASNYSHIIEICAEIKTDNPASKRAFSSAGFVEKKSEYIYTFDRQNEGKYCAHR